MLSSFCDVYGFLKTSLSNLLHGPIVTPFSVSAVCEEKIKESI